MTTITDVVGEVADVLAGLYPEAPAPGWRHVVETSLALTGDVPEGVAARAGDELKRFVRGMSAEAKWAHRRQLGLVAQRAFRFSFPHRDCAIDPKMAERAAQGGYGAMMAEGPHGDREYRLADNIATWLLGLWNHHSSFRHNAVKVLGADPKAQTWLGGINRWPSGRYEDRQKDIHQLTTGRHDVRRLFGRLMELTATSPEDLDQWLAFDSRNAVDGRQCYCSQPLTVIEALWGGGMPASWTAFQLDQEQSRLADDVVKASEPRRDVLRMGDDFIATDPQGVLDAVFVAAIGKAGDKAACEWQERAVFRELRDATLGRSGAWKNVPWSTDSGNLSRHDGECDALVLSDGFAVECQAKAGQSLDHEKRVRIVSGKALAQHQNFAEAAERGVHLINVGTASRPTLLRPGPLVVDGSSIRHLPITVGVESVHQFRVGGSAADGVGTPQVVTTVDHLRLVNAVLPDAYRFSYWIDRYAQEFSPIRIVDEVDFLGKWHLAFVQEPTLVKATEDGMMMASDSVVARWLAISSTFGGSERRDKEAVRMVREAKASMTRGYPTTVAPTMMAMLRDLLTRRTPGAVGLVRSTVGANYAEVERRMRNREDLFLSNPLGSWALTFDRPAAEEGATSVSGRRPDFVVAHHRGRWQLWQRSEWQSPDRLKPRWGAEQLARAEPA